MKKLIEYVMIITVIAMLTGCTSGQAAERKKNRGTASDPIVLRLANNHEPDYPTSQGCNYFADLVEERTDGRIKIEVYNSAELGGEKATIEQAQFGGIDFVRSSISPLAEYIDVLNVLQLPYLYRDEEHMWNVLEGKVGQELLEAIEPAKMIGLTWYDGGSRSLYNTKKEIKTPADLQGMKIRVPESELMMGMISALGGTPTPMAFGDVYNALENDVIEGGENNWPSYISTQHYKVAKYITVDEHSRIPEILFASKRTMERLHKEDKTIIEQAAQESSVKQREIWADYSKEAEETAKREGCSITYLDSTEPFQKAMEPLYEKFGAEYQDIIERIRKTE